MAKIISLKSRRVRFKNATVEALFYPQGRCQPFINKVKARLKPRKKKVRQ